MPVNGFRPARFIARRIGGSEWWTPVDNDNGTNRGVLYDFDREPIPLGAGDNLRPSLSKRQPNHHWPPCPVPLWRLTFPSIPRGTRWAITRPMTPCTPP